MAGSRAAEVQAYQTHITHECQLKCEVCSLGHQQYYLQLTGQDGNSRLRS